MEQSDLCAAVDKIKDQRKPADFIASPQTGGVAEDAAGSNPVIRTKYRDSQWGIPVFLF